MIKLSNISLAPFSKSPPNTGATDNLILLSTFKKGESPRSTVFFLATADETDFRFDFFGVDGPASEVRSFTCFDFDFFDFLGEMEDGESNMEVVER